MSDGYGANRWWENYLVRYLMPSIVGVAIVSWLCSYAGDAFRASLLLPPAGKPLDAASLTLVFMYGNLFCYIASFPILVFHVTRVIDFSADKWPMRPFSDGYILTPWFTVVAFAIFHLPWANLRFWAAFLLVAILVAVQMNRLRIVMSDRIQVRGVTGSVSRAFGFAYALARRRGIPEVIETTKLSTPDDPTSALEDADEDGSVVTKRTIEWRRDFIATYRHLREHGNSAFIFLLELLLAALVYCVIKKPGQTPEQQLGATGALFAIWASPAAFVHLLGQHLERRFSQFDRKVIGAETKS